MYLRETSWNFMSSYKRPTPHLPGHVTTYYLSPILQILIQSMGHTIISRPYNNKHYRQIYAQ